MSLFKVLDIAGSGLSAQSLRLNVTASNLANADSVSSSAGTAYRARYPIFAAALVDANRRSTGSIGVRVSGIAESQAPLPKEFRPDHPAADADGFIYKPNINVVEQMADMISASRTYQSNVEVINASKQMLSQTLSLGR